MGNRRPPHFTEPKVPRMDEWDAKALAEEVVGVAFAAGTVSLRPGKDASTLWELVTNATAADVVGWVRRVPLDAPVWAAPAFGVEVVLATIDSAAVASPGRSARPAAGSGGDALQSENGRSRPGGDPNVVRYRTLPVTPAVEFDLALLVPAGLTAARVESVIRSQAGELLERLTLFDQYEGKGVADGFRSVAWRLTFRHPDRTLRDKEIEGRRDKLLRTLEGELGIRPRTS